MTKKQGVNVGKIVGNIGLLLLVILSLPLLKMLVVGRNWSLILFDSIAQELPLCWFLFLFSLLAQQSKYQAVKISLHVVNFIVLFIFLTDIACQFCLSSRLEFSLLLTATGELKELSGYIFYYLRQPPGIWAIALFLCYIGHAVISIKEPLVVSKAVLGLVAFLLLLAAVNCQVYTCRRGYNPNRLNVFHYNLINKSNEYSRDYLPRGWTPQYERKGQEKAGYPNVIVVFLESFHTSSSQLLSSLDDDLPELDKIAAGGTYFTHYLANSINSSDSLFTILTGHITMNGKIGVGAPKFYEHGLIKYLQNHGIFTAMFTSAYDIFHFGQVAQAAQFAYRSTTDDPFYNQSRRMVFNSVPDRDLYNNLLDHVAGGKLKEPYFAMLVTASTHGPYTHPETGNNSYKECLKYADDELGAFYNKLKEINWFDNGIMLLVGDHHAMIPLTGAEKKLYKKKARYLVPLVVVGKGIPRQKNDHYFYHANLGALIEYLQVGTYELNQFQTDPVTFAEKPLLVSGVRDNTGWLFNHGGRDYQIHFGGDKTGYQDEQPDEIMQDYLYYIAWLSQNF